MTYRIICDDSDRCIMWVKNNFCNVVAESIGIGLEKNGKLVAVSTFGMYNGQSMIQHIAVMAGERLTRAAIWFVFYYAFIQIGVNVLITMINTDNEKSLRIAKHIGYKPVSRIDGSGLIIMTLHKSDCNWLQKKVRL